MQKANYAVLCLQSVTYILLINEKVWFSIASYCAFVKQAQALRESLRERSSDFAVLKSKHANLASYQEAA